MSETEISEDDASDIDECVLKACEKFMDDSFVAEAESSENSVLSLSASAPLNHQDTSPKSSRATNISRFVSS